MPAADTAEVEQVPGSEADKPQEIPARGWVQIAKRGWAEAKADNVPLMAAGMAYYAFLAIFPAIIAAVLLYSFFADPSTISAQIDSLGSAIPSDITDILKQQITSAAGNGKVGFGAVIAIVVALFSASGGMGNLMTAINICYDEEEGRGLVKKRLIALALTVGAIVFFLIVVSLVAVLPAVLGFLGTNGIVLFFVQAIRWVLIVVVITIALAVLYRVAPDRDAPKLRWVSVGAGVATLLWLVASVGFSLYVSIAGSYAKTYGTIAGIVILLLWLFITAYAILLGAEINAESEQQTVKDSTKGPAQPLGSRDAVKADSVPDPAEDGFDAEAPARGLNGSSSSDTSTNRSSKDSAMTDHLPSTTGPVDPADASVGDLIRNMSADLSTLVRDEIRLAQAEVGEKAKKAGIGIGAFGGAGVVALYGLGVLISAAVLALAGPLPNWLAALIVAVVLFVVAGIAALVGKKQLSQASPPVPTQAIASVKTDVAEIKESIKR